MELYPASSPNQTFSGTEFLGIIGKLEDYQRKQQGREPPTAGVPEPERRGPEVPPAERPTGDPALPEAPSGQVNAGDGAPGVPGSGRPL